MGKGAVWGEEVEDYAQEEEGILGAEGFGLAFAVVLLAFETSKDEIG